jgi:hypothetical protein
MGIDSFDGCMVDSVLEGRLPFICSGFGLVYSIEAMELSLSLSGPVGCVFISKEMYSSAVFRVSVCLKAGGAMHDRLHLSFCDMFWLGWRGEYGCIDDASKLKFTDFGKI